MMIARRRTLVVALVVLALGARAEPFVDRIVEVDIGPLGGGGDAAYVLGPPQAGGAFHGSTHTLSLGIDGSILVEFTDNVAVNGPGPDLTVFENAFLVRGATTLPPFAEPALVAVSADGVTFRSFPCAMDEAPFHPGCAGVYPVFAVDEASALVPSTTPIEDLVGIPVDEFVAPAGSGGDTFDLADVGLAAIRFVRIQGGALRTGLEGLGGFDLDAVVALHSVERVGTSDGDGDGIPDPADGCPTVSDPAQSDLDGDGVGDACTDEPGPPDADGDGLPDDLDDCPDVPNPDQRDGDGDGVGDACDRCVGRADPPAGEPCPPQVADADFDGTPDEADPCPHDPACTPLEPSVFDGTRRGGRLEGLLTYVLPAERRVVLPAGTRRVSLVVVIGPDVEPGSVEIRVGRRNVTAELGPFVPGSTRTIGIELSKRRTRVRLRARAVHTTARRDRDRDKFTFVVSRSKRSK